jgi:PTH1 family peptidyl-tRNA hydrolase
MNRFLIVGLGNVGEEYENTRHNIGCRIMDSLAETAEVYFRRARYGDLAEYRFRQRNLLLLKPSTYVNLSGKAVNYWMQKEQIPVENIFVVTDDIALPFGKIRIRSKGSDGGHNGLKSIIEMTGTAHFARLRFGVGREFPEGQQVAYVLGQWSEEEKKILPERIKICTDAIRSFSFHGIDRTMTLYNNK